MNRLFPMPVHSLMLTLIWLLLNGWTYGHLFLGLFLGLVIPIIAYPYVRGHTKVKKPLKMMIYLLRLLRDIIVANIDVARRVLMPNKHLKPGWIAYPLALQEAFPATVLASSISLTPGTVSVEFAEDMSCLYIHVLHLDDEKSLKEFIAKRYEKPLKEIFAC